MKHLNPDTLRVGFDIGRVLISNGVTKGDTSFLGGTDEDAMKTPPMPGAFDVVRTVTEALEGRTWLISKCGPRIQQRSRKWLAHHRFFERTGMPPDHLEFCRQRWEKAPICQRLKIDVFVDDRPDIHGHLAGIVPVRVLYGPQRGASPPGVLAARDWNEVADIVLPLVSRPVGSERARAK